MTLWALVQPVDRIWKIITDSERGIVDVYNEKEELIMEQKGLMKNAVLLIEDNFLEVVATRLTSKKSGNLDEIKKSISEYNPMYV